MDFAAVPFVLSDIGRQAEKMFVPGLERKVFDNVNGM